MMDFSYFFNFVCYFFFYIHCVTQRQPVFNWHIFPQLSVKSYIKSSETNMYDVSTRASLPQTQCTTYSLFDQYGYCIIIIIICTYRIRVLFLSRFTTTTAVSLVVLVLTIECRYTLTRTLYVRRIVIYHIYRRYIYCCHNQWQYIDGEAAVVVGRQK